MANIILITLVMVQLLSPATLFAQQPPGYRSPHPSSRALPPEYSDPTYGQRNLQQDQKIRIQQLEKLVAKQQEVIEALKTELKKFKESEGGQKP